MDKGRVIVLNPPFGKTAAIRRHLYLLWRRYQAGEDVGRPYLIGPGWKPPPGGFSGGFSGRTNVAKATAFIAKSVNPYPRVRLYSGGGQQGGKAQAMRRYLYDLWLRRQARGRRRIAARLGGPKRRDLPTSPDIPDNQGIMPPNRHQIGEGRADGARRGYTRMGPSPSLVLYPTYPLVLVSYQYSRGSTSRHG